MLRRSAHYIILALAICFSGFFIADSAQAQSIGCEKTRDDQQLYCGGSNNSKMYIGSSGLKVQFKDLAKETVEITGGGIQGTRFKKDSSTGIYKGTLEIHRDALAAGWSISGNCKVTAKISGDKLIGIGVDNPIDCPPQNAAKYKGKQLLIEGDALSNANTAIAQAYVADKPEDVTTDSDPAEVKYIREKLAAGEIIPASIVSAAYAKWGCEGLDQVDKQQGKCSLSWYRDNILPSYIYTCLAKEAASIPPGAPAETQDRIWDSRLGSFTTCIGEETDLSSRELQGLNIDLQSTYYAIESARRNGIEQLDRESAQRIEDQKIAAGDTEDPNTTTCGIEGVGWIVCPVLNFIAGINDSALGVISRFLTIKPDLLETSGTNNGTYQAWSTFRDIANVLFVVVFLIIVFSQISNIGINNYNIKKMLPRLIIGAILVNLSYFICQIAVDISNILGHTLANTIANIGKVEAIGSEGSSILSWVGVITAVLAGAGLAILAAMAITVPVILAGLVAVIVTVVILVGRQAAIILLVALSPLAFVAWLLPNTEQWFKRWWKAFSSLLLVFPIIAVLYGAGMLASNILAMAAGGGENQRDPDELLQIAALGVMIIPLAATPMILRGSLSAIGSIGTKLSNWSQKANGNIKNKIDNTSRLADINKQMKYKSIERQANRRAGNGLMARQGRRLAAYGERKGGAMGAVLKGTGKTATGLGGGVGRWLDNTAAGRLAGLDKGSGAAIQLVDELFEKDVKAAGLTLGGKTHFELKNMITNGVDENGSKISRAKLTAAIDKVMSTGGFSDRRDVLAHVGSTYTSEEDKTLRQRVSTAAYAKGDQGVYGVQFGDKFINGDLKSMDDLKAEAINNAASGNLQAEHLVSSASSTKWLYESIRDFKPTTSQEAADKLEAHKAFQFAAKKARSSPNTATKITNDIDETFKTAGVP